MVRAAAATPRVAVDLLREKRSAEATSPVDSGWMRTGAVAFDLRVRARQALECLRHVVPPGASVSKAVCVAGRPKKHDRTGAALLAREVSGPPARSPRGAQASCGSTISVRAPSEAPSGRSDSVRERKVDGFRRAAYHVPK